ncbi:protease Do-like protein 7 isoform X1 [Cinnamomum micranthum f. kanehirae]|uniref:Pro-apoptotic serine protease NMA111 n=1 Tax=Cinnamomum micranthum f. kanehirae TaxID=337451 RepID=A0A3S3PP10_9MAGN|nr:protease Do-like protein 7 isoform X1 [Cinnamomum micranthum f. kanehirae]
MGDILERLGSEDALGSESCMKEDLSMEIDPPPFQESVATAEDWRKALKKVVTAVVVLRTTAARAFDTEAAGASYATGFVVDKRRGIILTNRHVVKPGPVVAEAMFVNREEIPVQSIYRDPVHDFGFFRYDPGAIQFLSYEEIPLAPEAACVGLEIRVVGNDSGEKVSILAGTLARLDRDAPHYKKDGYNDFNTFYMQAASGTKGGSSGSPVIDWQGRAVALNAGSKSSSASAFFLPLERVVRALNFLQSGGDAFKSKWEAVSIPRGTLQVTFVHKGFDETRRLGLRTETEQMVRHASPIGETGMLVVDSVVPGGPAHKHLEPGDVLVRINGEVITQFLKLETLLDDGIDQKIELRFERGGIPMTVTLLIQDLHLITPNYFLEVSGAVIHPLSYQQARNFRFQCGLVYVTETGYMLSRAGVPRHAIIKKFAGEEITELDKFISVLSKLSRGTRVPLEYITYTDRYRSKSVLVTIECHEWYAPPQIYTRDDSTGLWTARPAILHGSPLLSPIVDSAGNGMSYQATTIDSIHQHNDKDWRDGCTGMQTNEETVVEELHIQVGSNVETKRRRVEEDLAAEGIVMSDAIIHEPREETMEDSRILEHTDLLGDRGSAAVATNASVAEQVIEPTLVMFEVHVPPSCMLDGVHSQHFFGTGVIIYHSQSMGLVAVDKNTVAVSVSDVMISFAAYPIEIPGEVIFLHPVHNYALVAYDPSALGVAGASAVRAAELLPEPALRRGDSVYLVGLSRSLQATSRKSIVTNPYAALNIGSADCPRYRATNMEVIELDTDFGSTFSGVLTDEYGRVQALWGSFSTQVDNKFIDHRKLRNLGKKRGKSKKRETNSKKDLEESEGTQADKGKKETPPKSLGKELTRPTAERVRKLKYGCNSSEDHQFVRGIPIYAISQVLDSIICGAKGPSLLINGIKRPMPLVRILEAELYPTLLSKARSFGLSDKWVQALAKKDPVRRQVLRVKGCLAGSKAENLLEQGDMLLAIKKEPITCFRDIENACHDLDKSKDNEGELNMTIFRQGQEIELQVGIDVRDGNGTAQMMNWCGCIVQDSHPAVRALGFLPEEGHGVYVARWCHGSPAHRYGLYALQWIVEVNGKLTPDLETFVDVTKALMVVVVMTMQGLEHGEFVRVKTVHLNGKPRVLTLKQDLHYWPTWELKFDPDTTTWRRRTIKALDYSMA